jgi:hypothetical protein
MLFRLARTCGNRLAADYQEAVILITGATRDAVIAVLERKLRNAR